MLRAACSTQAHRTQACCSLASRRAQAYGAQCKLGAHAPHARAPAQGKKLALEQSRIGIMKGSMQKLDNPDTYWSIMTGTKVQPPEDTA